MKKKVLIALAVVIAIAATACSGSSSGTKEEKWAEDGIYLYQTSGYAAYHKGEPVVLKLLLLSLHKTEKVDLMDYQFIALLDKDGNEYPVGLELYDPENYNKEKETTSLVVQDMRVDNLPKKPGKTELTSIKLEKDGKAITRDFGSIIIERLDSKKKKEIRTSSDTAGASDMVEYHGIFENSLKENITIDKAFFGKEIKNDLKKTEVKAGKTIEKTIKLTPEEKNFAQSPVCYVTKPTFSLGDSRQAADQCMAYYGIDLSNQELRNYLLKQEEQQ